MKKHAALAAELADMLLDLFVRPEQGRIVATLLREDGTMLVYSLTAPPADPDVAKVGGKRVLNVSVDGTAQPEQTFDGTVNDFGELKVAQGAQVTLTLDDIDDGGNHQKGGPTIQAFTAADTIPPTAAGEITVTPLREEP